MATHSKTLALYHQFTAVNMVHAFRKKSLLWGGALGLCITFLLFLVLSTYWMENFRTTQDLSKAPEGVDATGLYDLQASGGSLPRFPTLAWRLSHVKADKIIVNAESQPVDFVSGLPSTLFAYKNKKFVWKHYLRRFLFTGTFKERSDLIVSEEALAKKYGFRYKTVIIGSRFVAEDQHIEDIVTFFDTLPKDAWVHFHCAHGLGRTSMLLVMLDIMKNAPEVALKDIVKRQYLLGSVDLFDTVVWANGVYTKKMLEDRKTFVEDFYAFIIQRKAGGTQLWSAWKSQK
jgi:hypothetical protein